MMPTGTTWATDDLLFISNYSEGGESARATHRPLQMPDI